MSGNTTFLICSERRSKIDEIIEIIKDHSHKRKQFVPSAASYGVGSYRQLSCRGICRRCDYLRDEHREILRKSDVCKQCKL